MSNPEITSGLNLINNFDDEAKKITTINIISKRAIRNKEISLFRILEIKYNDKEKLLNDLTNIEFHLENKFIISWIFLQNNGPLVFDYCNTYSYSENYKIEIKDSKLYLNLNNEEGSNE